MDQKTIPATPPSSSRAALVGPGEAKAVSPPMCFVQSALVRKGPDSFLGSQRRARYVCEAQAGLILPLWLMLLTLRHYRLIAFGHLVPTLVAVSVTAARGRRPAAAFVRCHSSCISRSARRT